MAQKTNLDGYRALLVPDPRLTPDIFTIEGVAVCSEAGARPGQALPSQEGTEAVVKASGVQDETSYALTCLRGGYNGNAEYGWTATESGTTTVLRGCNMPNLAGDVRHIGGGEPGGLGGAGGWPASVKTGSGRVVWVWAGSVDVAVAPAVYASYTDDGITIVGADSSIKLMSTDEDDDAYIGYDLDNDDCVCALYDDERDVVQAWVRVIDPVNSKTQFVLFESYDDGATWEVVQRNCLVLPYTATYDLRRPVVARVAGAIVLIQPEDTSPDYVVSHFISLDRGRSLSILVSDATPYRNFEAVEFNGRVQLAAISAIGDDVYVASMSTAFESVVEIGWEATAAIQNVGSIALVVQHGLLWLYSTPTTYYRVDVATSLTGAADDYELFGNGLLSFEGSGSLIDIEEMSAVGAFGGVMLAFKVSDAAVDIAAENRLFAIRCGGWSTFTTARHSPTATYREGRVAFGAVNASGAGTWYGVDRTTWYPFLAPEDITGPIWTDAGAGTDAFGCDTGGSPYRSVSCTAGQTRYWSQTFAEDLTKGILVYFDCEITDGGSSTSNDSAVRVVLSNGTSAEYNVTARLTESGVYLKDNVGGAVSAILSNPAGARRSYLLAVRQYASGQAIASLYQARYTSLDGLQNVVYLGQLNLEDDATPTANSSVEFGVVESAGGVIEQKWYAFHFIAASGVEAIYDPAVGSILGTDKIAGAPTSSTPVELQRGLNVSFTGGPLKFGEGWAIAPKYDYAKEHVYPHLYPSPRQKWRSGDDGATHTFQWDFNTDDAPEGLGAQAWGVALIGCNFAVWELQGFNAAGSWVDILTVDNSDEFTSLPYRAGYRTGASAPYLTVNMSGSGNASRFIHENELAGGTVKVGSQLFKIVRNTSGTWSTTAGKKPVLFLASWDSAITETGTLDIWPPNALAIKQALGTTEYRRLRFRITAATTADGYYELGALVIGPVYIFGKQYSKGRVMTRSANVSVNETVGGASSAVRNGPTRRSVEFGWFEGIDQTDIYDLTDEPDYVTTGDAAVTQSAAAVAYDTPTMLDGLYARINGPELPVVYIPHIPYNTDETAEFVSTDYTINGFVYGRTVGDVKVTTVTGTEQTDEVAQIGVVQIREDV